MTKLVSLRAFARHRGVTLRAVQKARDSGRIVLVNGKVDLEASDAAWTANTDESMRRDHAALASETSKASAEAAGSFMEARIRRERALAERAELDLARRRGALIPVAEVEIGWSEIVSATRNRLLGIVPSLRVFKPASIDEVLDRVDEAITAALGDLADGKGYLDGDDAGAEA
jgi:phage terminase Nu1 subunit (DNA packaging protein)